MLYMNANAEDNWTDLVIILLKLVVEVPLKAVSLRGLPVLGAHAQAFGQGKHCLEGAIAVLCRVLFARHTLMSLLLLPH